MQRFPRLLGALLAAIGLAGILTACEGQPCPVGLPAPPPVALFQDGGNLYFSSPGSASALRASDGSQRWQTQNEYFLGAGNALAFALSNKSLQALRAGDHSLLWQHPLAAPYPFSAPLTVTDGIIYFSDGESVLALRASDGAQLWAQDTREPLTHLLAVGAGMVYVVTEKASVEALRASDGSQRWQTDLGNIAVSSLVADGNQVYVGASSLIESLRADSGAKLWQKSPQSGSEHVWAANSSVVYISADASLQALRGLDGTPLWQITITSASISALLLNGQALYFTNGNLLRAVQASSGASLWQHPISRLDGGFTHALAATDTGVYVGLGGFVHHGSGCGTTSSAIAMEAVRPTDGSLLWSFQA